MRGWGFYLSQLPVVLLVLFWLAVGIALIVAVGWAILNAVVH